MALFVVAAALVMVSCEKTTEGMKKDAADVVEATEEAAADVTKKAKEATKDAGDAMKKKSGEAVEATKDAAKDVGDKMKKAVNDTAKKVEDATAEQLLIFERPGVERRRAFLFTEALQGRLSCFARKGAVRLSFTLSTSSGGAAATRVPPSAPASGPISMR